MNKISITTPQGLTTATSSRLVREGNPFVSGYEAQNTQPEKHAPRKIEEAVTAAANLIDRYVPKDLPNTRLQIEQDETTGLFIYRSVDKESGEVLRQYPADEVLKFISYYRESEGLVVDSKA